MPPWLDSLISFSAPIAQGCESAYCDLIHSLFLISKSSQPPPIHLMFSGKKDWCVILTLPAVSPILSVSGLCLAKTQYSSLHVCETEKRMAQSSPLTESH